MYDDPEDMSAPEALAVLFALIIVVPLVFVLEQGTNAWDWIRSRRPAPEPVPLGVEAAWPAEDVQ